MMAKCGKCGGGQTSVETIPSYDAELLGAPFKVVLEQSVRREFCEACGSTIATIIPDLDGLAHSVAMYRAVMPRKLNGAEIKFLRSAIGCKAKEVAEKLDFAPEHLSRCENDSKLLSPLAEKWFRFFVIVKALDKTRKKASDFTAIKKHADPDTLLEMKIESTWDPSESLCLRLTHRKSEVQPDLFDDGEWENEQQRDRAA